MFWLTVSICLQSKLLLWNSCVMLHNLCKTFRSRRNGISSAGLTKDGVLILAPRKIINQNAASQLCVFLSIENLRDDFPFRVWRSLCWPPTRAQDLWEIQVQALALHSASTCWFCLNLSKNNLSQCMILLPFIDPLYLWTINHFVNHYEPQLCYD